MAKPGNNYNYMQRYMMAYSTRLEEALERIMETDDVVQARMIAAAALGRDAGGTLGALLLTVDSNEGAESEPDNPTAELEWQL